MIIGMITVISPLMVFRLHVSVLWDLPPLVEVKLPFCWCRYSLFRKAGTVIIVTIGAPHFYLLCIKRRYHELSKSFYSMSLKGLMFKPLESSMKVQYTLPSLPVFICLIALIFVWTGPLEPYLVSMFSQDVSLNALYAAFSSCTRHRKTGYAVSSVKDAWLSGNYHPVIVITFIICIIPFQSTCRGMIQESLPDGTHLSPSFTVTFRGYWEKRLMIR